MNGLNFSLIHDMRNFYLVRREQFMYCRTCGQSNPDWSNYCIYDGTSLVNDSSSKNVKLANKETNFCPGCGGKISGTDNYCQSCGYSLLKFTVGEEDIQVVPPSVTKVLKKGKSINWSNVEVITIAKKVFVPAVLAFAIMFILNMIFSTFVTSPYDKLFEQAFNTTPEEMAVQMAEQYNADVRIPKKLTGVTDYVMASHLLTPNFAFDVKGSEYGDLFQVNGELNASVKSVLYLILPFIALMIGGVFYRKKNPAISIQSFLLGAIGIGVIYGFILSIVSLFSGFDFHANAPGGDVVSLAIEAKYSFVFALLKGFAIGTIFSLLGMLFSIDRRRITKHLETLVPIGTPIHQGTAAFFRSFATITVIVMFIVFKKFKGIKASLAMLGVSRLDELLDKSWGVVSFVGLHLSSFIYSIIHFSPLSFELTNRDYESEGIGYSILSGFSQKGDIDTSDFHALAYLFSTQNYNLYLKLAILIPVIFLMYSGYRMAKTNLSYYKSFVILSLVYSILATILTSIASISISGHVTITGEGSEGSAILFAASTVKMFIGSFIIAFAASYLGSYGRKFLSKR